MAEYADIDGLVVPDDDAVDAGKDLLTSPAYDDWVEALVNDDVSLAEKLYSSANADERNAMLNGVIPDYPFTRKEAARIRHTFHSHMTLTKPWATAVVYGSVHVMDFMIKEGVNIHQRDHHGNTAIHCLIKVAAIDVTQEKQHLKTFYYLKDKLGQDVFNDCLLIEDDNKMRPLELAAHLGTFLIMDAIFNSDGVYLSYKEQYGIHTLHYYDITEYESVDPDLGSRSDRSPIRMMVYLDKNRLSEEATRTIFKTQPYVTWFKAKWSTNCPLVFLWCMVRTFYLFLFFTCNLETSAPTEIFHNVSQEVNATSWDNETLPTMCNEQVPPASITNQILVGILGSMSLGVIIFDLVDTIRYIILAPSWVKHRRRHMVLHYPFYRVVQCLLAVCVLSLAICHVVNYELHAGINLVAEHTLYVLASSGCIWSILYFIQLVPWLGHYVIAVQRMIQAFAQFAMLFFLFLVSYIFAFRRVIMDTEGQCPEEFSTTGLSFYNTFLIMLDMVQLDQFDVIDKWGLYVLHMLYVFLVAVLLVNFLIAIMSDEYSDVADNRDVISRVQTLSVMVKTENRISCLLKSLYASLKGRSYICRGDKIYITKLVMMKRNDDEY